MPTSFYAVQCCQCSTMQVKQKSKNNKWTCVVCNQKQSVRNVFAQSPMARDLRPFVQSSNMSRHFTQQEQHHDQAIVSDVPECDTQKKRPIDWTQYLDAEADQCAQMKQEDDESGGGSEPQVVTELPRELFKKQKMSKCCDNSGGNGGVTPTRNSDKHLFSPTDMEDWRSEMTMNKNLSDCSHLMMQEEKESRTLQVTKATCGRASKWNDYITKDDNDGLRIIKGKIREENSEQWSDERKENYGYETVTTDETVEDDIHPDFLQR